MKPGNRKKILESKKAKTFYLVGMVVAMLISVGGLFLAKAGHGGAQLWPDSLGSLSSISILGWVMGLCGVMGAAVFSRRSKGIYTLTGVSLTYSGVTDRDRWTLENSAIRDSSTAQSWMEARLGCSRIVLTLDETAVDKNRVEIGPFNKKVAERWLAELKRIGGDSVQPPGNNRKKAKSV
jgi:hypothetical protein